MAGEIVFATKASRYKKKQWVDATLGKSCFNLQIIPLILQVVAGAPSVHTEMQFFQHILFSSNVAVIEL